MLADLSRNTSQFAKTNAGTILTTVAVAGTISTAILTGRAALKCSYLQEEFKGDNWPEVKSRYKARYVVENHWRDLAPVVVSGGITVGAIVMAHRVEAGKAAAMAAAYGISDRAFKEYKAKVVEKLGEAKEGGIRDEINTAKVENLDVTNLVVTGEGEVLCFDSWSGRTFVSTMEDVKAAVNDTNKEILDHMYASLSTFYDYLGIPATTSSDLVGWNSNNLLDVHFTTAIKDKKPVLVMDFVDHPMEGYGRLYS